MDKKLFDAHGNWITCERYQEIHRLDKMLVDAGIPHTMAHLHGGWQIIYPKDGKQRVMDAVEHHFSYGEKEDLLEIMGLLTPEEAKNDSVVGYLTAENVFSRIKEHWAHNKTEEKALNKESGGLP